MRRRRFMSLLGGALAAAPLAAGAQQKTSAPRIGVLWHAGNAEEEAVGLGALRQGFSDLGYVEGRNIALVNTFAAETYERFNDNAEALVGSNVDVIVAVTGPAAHAAKRATTTIPIVFVIVPDPLGSKLVDSLAHPGGNITGLTHLAIDTTGKRMALFKEAVADLSRVALLVNAGDPEVARRTVEEIVTVGGRLGLTVQSVEVRGPSELARAFSALDRDHVDGMFIAVDPMFWNERARISGWALAQRLPITGPAAEYPAAGALMSYGVNNPALFRRASAYVDKLLKGARPSDLPVEQPTKFDLVINLKTAKALGVVIPPSLIARADDVIE